jgi:hypothetical protein
VRAILTRAGLAARTVADVSDYPFTVQEARATLWVFRLDQAACAGGTPTRPAQAAEAPTTVRAGEPVASTEVVFEPRSSFFPPGTETALKRLLARLPKAPGYVFALEAAIGDGVAGPKEEGEGARYQRWIAERRLARLTDWLEQNAEFREVAIERSFLAHDPSGRVTVRVHPLPPRVTGGPGLPISPGQQGSGGGDGAGDRG